MRKYLLVFIFLLSGCYTSPVSNVDATPINKDRLYSYQEQSDSTIIVTRDSGLFAGGCKVDFHIDGKLAASFKPKETANFYVSAGKHIIAVNACGGGALIENSITLDNGETSRYRIYIDEAGTRLMPTAVQ